MKKTMLESVLELKEAFNDVIISFVEAYKIDKLIYWLDRKINERRR